MYEDYYDKHPQEAELLLQNIAQEQDVYSSFIDEDAVDVGHEEMMQKEHAKFFQKNTFDLKQFQSSEKLTPEKEQAILDSLGRNNSKINAQSLSPVTDDEFEDNFE